jgi:glycosyltransferase involved in cell wall biosynthesis
MEIYPEKKKLKGIYLVPDPMMLKPDFGPSEHIKVGLRELKKYFDIEIFVFGELVDFKNKQIDAEVKSRSQIATSSGLFGVLRDLKLLYLSNKNKRTLTDKIKALDIDFIFERGQYLDLRGVRIAKDLGIKHFYEVNWVNYLGIQQFYKSWFTPIAKKIEEWSYNNSSMNFFVGTQHKLLNINSSKVTLIQNGIDSDLISQNGDHVNIIRDKIKLCFVSNLMPHHRFDIFIEALIKCQDTSQFEVHLVGYHFEDEIAKFPQNVVVINHGPIKKDELGILLKEYNVGIISGGPSYSSFMKLFEYAACKLAIVCPDLENVVLMFDKKEIFYFKTDSATSLAKVLDELPTQLQQIKEYGENIYDKVKSKYTWDNIYLNISNEMILNLNTTN